MLRLTLRRSLVGMVFFLAVFLFYTILDAIFIRFSPTTFKKQDIKMRKIIHYSNYKYGDLDGLTERHKHFKDKPLPEKCTIFFNDLMTSTSGKSWRFPTMSGRSYNKDIDKSQRFFNRERKNLLSVKSKEGLGSKISLSEKNSIKTDFDQQVKNSRVMDQQMADAISIMRVYNKCFFGGDGISYDFDKWWFNDITLRVFPYINSEMPSFDVVIENKTTTFNNGLPEFKNGEFTGNVLTPDKDQNLFDFYHKNISGKGIVLSATSSHAKDIARLIRVLRALNNSLPIQIVYRGNLSRRSKAIIIRAANIELDEGKLDPKTSELEKEVTSINSSFPKQTVIFTNIKRITDKKNFATYNNKLLSVFFSSFKEIMLLDADSVPLLEPEKFFHSSEYLDTSTFFFKDRSLRDTNDYLETNFVQRLFPMNNGSLESLFGMNILNKSSLEGNNYLRGYRHFQEAGVVLLDKKKHFNAITMLLPLGIWKEPLKTAMWGDKEFYWISLLMAGDDNFRFNENEAAAVGVASSDALKIYDYDSDEVCSTHPGHVNEFGDLLWINSGFSFCKKNRHYKDKSKYPFCKVPITELQNIYKNPFKITHALVPPSLPDYRDLNDEYNIGKEKQIEKTWKGRLKDSDEIKDFHTAGPLEPKISNPPQKGWVKSPICAGYYYCGYSIIQSYHPGKDHEFGKLYVFNDTTVSRIDTLGKLWMTHTPKSASEYFIAN